MINKKANINQLFPAVMAIILIGALVCIGIGVLSAFQDTTYTAGTSDYVVNESLLQAATGGITLTTGASTRNGVCGAIDHIINGTSGAGANIGLGNITQVGCVVTNATEWALWGNWTASVRYSYPYTFDNATTSTNAIISANTSLSALATAWIPIIIVVICAGLILSILLGAFSGKKK